MARVSEGPARRDGRVSVGAWPRLAAQILRARLETAGVAVLAEGNDRPDGVVTLAVPPADAEFASAVVHELEVDDEVPDTSPVAYVARIEEQDATEIPVDDGTQFFRKLQHAVAANRLARH